MYLIYDFSRVSLRVGQPKMEKMSTTTATARFRLPASVSLPPGVGYLALFATLATPKPFQKYLYLAFQELQEHQRVPKRAPRLPKTKSCSCLSRLHIFIKYPVGFPTVPAIAQERPEIPQEHLKTSLESPTCPKTYVPVMICCVFSYHSSSHSVCSRDNV